MATRRDRGRGEHTMNKPFTRSSLLAMLIGGLASVAFLSAAGASSQEDQRPAAAPGTRTTKSAPTPRTSDGKVDFSGIWSPDRNFIYDVHDALKKGEQLPLQ